MGLLELYGNILPGELCRRRLLYQSTPPAVANSTSAMVRYGPSWKTVVRCISALQKPSIDSIEGFVAPISF